MTLGISASEVNKLLLPLANPGQASGAQSRGTDSRRREQRWSLWTANIWVCHPFYHSLGRISIWEFYFFSCEISLVSNYQYILSLLFSCLKMWLSKERNEWKNWKREKIKLVKNRNTWFRKLINSISKIKLHCNNIALKDWNTFFLNHKWHTDLTDGFQTFSRSSKIHII